MRQRFELLLQALALQRQFSDSVLDQLTVRCRDILDHRADLLINCTQPRLESDLRLSNLCDLAPKLFIQRRSNAFASVTSEAAENILTLGVSPKVTRQHYTGRSVNQVVSNFDADSDDPLPAVSHDLQPASVSA